MNKELKLQWKLYIQLCDKYLHFSFHKLFASQTDDYSVFCFFCDSYLMSQDQKFCSIIYTKPIIVCPVCWATTVKLFWFAQLWDYFKKSSQLDNFPVSKVMWEVLPLLRNAPSCYWSRIESWRYRISWEIGGGMQKTPALIASASSPFPFSRFSPPPPPLFCACHVLYNV